MRSNPRPRANKTSSSSDLDACQNVFEMGSVEGGLTEAR